MNNQLGKASVTMSGGREAPVLNHAEGQDEEGHGGVDRDQHSPKDFPVEPGRGFRLEEQRGEVSSADLAIEKGADGGVEIVSG